MPENTSYQFRVRAKNSLGYGEYSSELSIATLMGTIGTIKAKNYYSTPRGSIIVNDIYIVSVDNSATLSGTEINTLLQ